MLALIFVQSEDTSHETEGTPHKFDQEASTSRHPDKVSYNIAHLVILIPWRFCHFNLYVFTDTEKASTESRGS